MFKSYIVTVEYKIKVDVGMFEVQTDDEAVEKVKNIAEKIREKIEEVLDIGSEVEISNYYTELC